MVKNRLLRIVWAAAIALALAILLHQPWSSAKSFLIGGKVLTFPEMTSLELLAGAITSLVVIALCALILRALSMEILATAVLIQLLWSEFEWGFSINGSGNELFVRFAEEAGIALVGIVIAMFIRFKVSRHNPT